MASFARPADNEIENVNIRLKEWKSRRNRAKDKKRGLNGRLWKKRAKEKKRGLNGRLGK